MAFSYCISTDSRIYFYIIGASNATQTYFKLKEDRKGLAMIVDEQLNALEKDDFAKVIIKLLSLKKWCTCYSIIMLHS